MGMRFSFLFVSVILFATSLFATTSVWDGNNGVDPTQLNWTSSPNWTSTVPTFSGNYDVIFSGNKKLSNVADTNNWSLNSVSFSVSAGTYSISGQKLTIGSGGITNSSNASQTISNQIELSSNQTWYSVGNLTLSNHIDASNKSLTLDGPGSITLSSQLSSPNVVTLSGTGNRNISTITNSNLVKIQNTGTNTFSGIINTNKLEITSGNNTFSNTINSQSQGISITGNSNAIFNGEINSGSNGIYINGTGNIDFNGKINSAGTLSINGGANVLLSGNGQNNISNTYVNDGNLVLDQTGGTAINGQLTVGNGGVVDFVGDGQLPSWQTVTLLEGSTLFLNDTTQTISNLVITGDSVIDFGTGGSTLNVQNLTVNNDAVLTIQNWNTAVDVFIAVNNPNNSVVKIYYADTGQSATWSGGFITPNHPVPEPSSYGIISMSILFGFVCFRRTYYKRS